MSTPSKKAVKKTQKESAPVIDSSKSNLKGQFEHYVKQIEENNVKISTLESQLEKAASTNQELENQIASLKQENEKLQDQLKPLQETSKNLAALQLENSSLSSKLEELKKQYKQLHKENNNLISKDKDMAEKVVLLNEKIHEVEAASRQQQSDLSSKNEELAQEIIRYKQENSKLSVEIEELKSRLLETKSQDNTETEPNKLTESTVSKMPFFKQSTPTAKPEAKTEEKTEKPAKAVDPRQQEFMLRVFELIKDPDLNLHWLTDPDKSSVQDFLKSEFLKELLKPYVDTQQQEIDKVNISISNT